MEHKQSTLALHEHQDCPPVADLFHVLLGSLDDSKRKRILDHCQVCPICSARLQDISNIGVSPLHADSIRGPLKPDSLFDHPPAHNSRHYETPPSVNHDSSRPKKKLYQLTLLFLLLLFLTSLALLAYKLDKTPRKAQWTSHPLERAR